jgi:hypothetical protein
MRWKVRQRLGLFTLMSVGGLVPATRKVMLAGLALGLTACAYCLTLEYRARTAPAGSDATMAAALAFDLAARPLSFVTRDITLKAGAGASVIADSAQVLGNWVLLGLLAALCWNGFARLTVRSTRRNSG